MNACLIANPAAGRGRGARRLPAVRAALGAKGIHDVRLTRAAGEERDLAARAASDGIDTIIALGGDGTWGNVTRGILEAGRDARLVPIAAGTGNDFPHALGLPAHDPVAMARIAAGTGVVRVDVGWANDIAFLNVAGLGLETEVVQAVRRMRGLRGPMMYIAAALPNLRSYRGFRASIQRGDEAPGPWSQWCAIVASNGPRFGGGFRVAPGATVTDGKIDLISVQDALPFRRLQLFVRARLGTHEGQAEVERRPVTNVTIRFVEPPFVDCDGELHALRSKELLIRVQPAAIRVGTHDWGQTPISIPIAPRIRGLTPIAHRRRGLHLHQSTRFGVTMNHARLGMLITAALVVIPGTVVCSQQPAPAPEVGPKVGEIAPDFEFTGITRYGKLANVQKLSDFRGQTVVLAFFPQARTRG